MDEGLSARLAADLLNIGAVSFAVEQPFTWASGLLSPVYCDNRLTISFPDVRRRIRDGFIDVLGRDSVAPDVVAGTATAGIPHAAWLAEALDLPLVYVRSRTKLHGKGSQIEGRLDAGARVVLIEDLISTGGSSIEAAGVLSRGGGHVESVCAIFSYGLSEASRRFESAGLQARTLTGFDVLLTLALDRGMLGESLADDVLAWRRDPAAWSEARRMQVGG